MLSNKVREIMSRDVVTAEVSDRIWGVMERMVAEDVGALIVVENHRPVGIFTEQDVLKRVMNKKLDPKKIGIKRVMTSPIRAVREDARIVDVLGRMYRGKFRHMLVRGEKGAMAGLVSMRDILKLAVELGRDLTETQTIGSIMSNDPVTVEDSRSIDEVMETMIKKDTTGVVVMSREEPEGIFTERDVLNRVAVKSVDTKKTPIKKVMTPNPLTMAESTLVAEVLRQMHERQVRNMPVCGEGGRLTGFVSMGDVLKYAKALDVDENVRKAWKEIEEFWDSDVHYTPG